MNLQLYFLSLFIVLFCFTAEAFEPPPHLDLETSSQELERILQQQAQISRWTGSDKFEQIISVGRRNLDWLVFMNSFRREPLQFTQPGQLRGIPITSPRQYSDTILVNEFAALRNQLSPEMTAVLLQNQPFTQEPPANLKLYLEQGRLLDRLYQTALRWTMMQPYLPWLSYRRKKDVRGFYFLSQVESLQQKLDQFDPLPDSEKNNLKAWLFMICFNTHGQDAPCQYELNQAFSKKTLYSFYLKYLPAAEMNYKTFFNLQNPRDDFTWTTYLPEPSIFKIYPTATLEQQIFLQTHLQDEWQWQDWKLKIEFSTNAQTSVVWQPGITPHVNELGGSQVFMNADTPLSEWDAQWTIRHEFGHVLGLPDCYIEFYDESAKVIISYQIDTEDLMCSRAGKMNQRIYDELLKAYR